MVAFSKSTYHLMPIYIALIPSVAGGAACATCPMRFHCSTGTKSVINPETDGCVPSSTIPSSSLLLQRRTWSDRPSPWCMSSSSMSAMPQSSVVSLTVPWVSRRLADHLLLGAWSLAMRTILGSHPRQRRLLSSATTPRCTSSPEAQKPLCSLSPTLTTCSCPNPPPTRRTPRPRNHAHVAHHDQPFGGLRLR